MDTDMEFLKSTIEVKKDLEEIKEQIKGYEERLEPDYKRKLSQEEYDYVVEFVEEYKKTEQFQNRINELCKPFIDRFELTPEGKLIDKEKIKNENRTKRED